MAVYKVFWGGSNTFTAHNETEELPLCRIDEEAQTTEGLRLPSDRQRWTRGNRHRDNWTEVS